MGYNKFFFKTIHKPKIIIIFINYIVIHNVYYDLIAAVLWLLVNSY